RRAAMVDESLRELFAAADAPPGLGLVALGGYGRGELAPASDLDLLVLHGSRRSDQARAAAERLFYPLWDAGFTVGHAVRTVRDCQALAAARLDAATALLDARLLAGDEELFTRMRDRVLADVRSDAEGFVGRLRDAATERRARFGSVSHLLEPDVKEGAGGLRDVHTIRWAGIATTGEGMHGLEAAGSLRGSERGALESAEDFLMRLRSALQLESGRKIDRVHLDYQPSLASVLGFEDEPGLPAVDGLMRATFEHARQVEHVLDHVLARLLQHDAIAGGGTRNELQLGTPADAMAAFARAAEGPAPLSPQLLDEVEGLPLPEEVPWSADVRDAFLRIVRAGERGVATLEAMDRVGVLTRFLPEWEAVRCRPQRDPYHRFTVDVHLLETLGAVARTLERPPGDDPVAVRAAAAVRDQDGLLLGALLHDIGKTGRGGHVEAGARIATAVLDRMGIQEPSRGLAGFLVEHHLLLSDTAVRRDLEDEDLVLDVAARVGDPERLAALYLLTAADAWATGPHASTPWRRTLVRELVAKVQHVLERGDMGAETATRLTERAAAIREWLAKEDPAEVEAFLASVPRGYVLAVSPEAAARHFRLVRPVPGAVEVRTAAEPGSRAGTYALTVVARDRPGLLARIAGTLALSGLSILSAQVFTTEAGVAIDLFDVIGAFQGGVDEERWRRFRSLLRRAVEGRLSLEHRVRDKRRSYPPPKQGIPVKVTVDNGASDFYTVIEVEAADRIGLLFDVTRTFADLDLDVHVAKVATYGERVVDAFYVRDVLGRKVEDPEAIAEIEQAVTARLSD
ncbi:MAG: ACT domain-containing protein, partial [Actinomycetota bacterium]|nr:ACT domain-containing protein [Actinomycetota bacterium]